MRYAALPLAWTLAAAGTVEDPAGRARERLAAAEAVTALEVQSPAESMSLGHAASVGAKTYRCWKLTLTGERGKQARSALERLKSLQAAVTEERANLARDLEHPAKAHAVAARTATLERLLAAFDELSAAGQKSGLVRSAEKSFMRSKPALLPKIENTDYTMEYDAAKEGCPPPARR